MFVGMVGCRQIELAGGSDSFTPVCRSASSGWPFARYFACHGNTLSGVSEFVLVCMCMCVVCVCVCLCVCVCVCVFFCMCVCCMYRVHVRVHTVLIWSQVYVFSLSVTIILSLSLSRIFPASQSSSLCLTSLLLPLCL